jgi:GntR family transcriptional regulator
MIAQVVGPLTWRPMSDNPPYQAIADQLRAEVLAGTWDRPDVPFPGARAVGERFGVSIHTASRAIQQLAAQGLLVTKGGQRPLVVHPDERSTAWPLTRRYARARAAQGLVFASDVSGDMRKATITRGWVLPSPAVARLLRVDPGVDVFRRVSRTYLGNRPVEDTAMHFPPAVIADVPGLATDDDIQVVRLIEATGRKITRTVNRLRARQASAQEIDLLQLVAPAVVFEHTHGTYGADDEPLEAVVNIKPADNTVLTFETYEGD